MHPGLIRRGPSGCAGWALLGREVLALVSRLAVVGSAGHPGAVRVQLHGGRPISLAQLELYYSGDVKPPKGPMALHAAGAGYKSVGCGCPTEPRERDR